MNGQYRELDAQGVLEQMPSAVQDIMTKKQRQILESQVGAAEMAKAMGMEQESSKSASTLPRLKLSKETIMGQKEVDGVMETVVKVNPGSFFLEFPEENDTHYYAKV